MLIVWRERRGRGADLGVALGLALDCLSTRPVFAFDFLVLDLDVLALDSGASGSSWVFPF